MGRRVELFFWPLIILPCLVIGGALLYAATLATRSFSINGIYWISLPANPSPPITNAEDLLATLPFETVARFHTETDSFYTWDGTTCTPAIDPEAVGPGAPCTTACFCVIPGEGYQVRVNSAPVDWEIEGLDGLTVYSFTAAGPGSMSGSHLISLPMTLIPPFDTAKDLLVDTGAMAVSRYLTATDATQVYTFGAPDSRSFPARATSSNRPAPTPTTRRRC